MLERLCGATEYNRPRRPCREEHDNIRALLVSWSKANVP